MDILQPLIDGLQVGFAPMALLYLGIGVLLGIVVGALPGMGPTMGMALALPFAIRTTPEYAIFLLVAIMVGSNFGNSLTAVLLRIPGTPAALLTVVEGHPFQKRGEGGRALLVCLWSSFLGQLLGIVIFVLFVVPIAAVAIRFLFPEVFAITLFGLLAAASMLGKNLGKGLLAVAFGLALTMIGPDPITGADRYTFGAFELSLGLQLVPVLVGLLAVREIIDDLLTGGEKPIRSRETSWRAVALPRPRWADLKATWWPSWLGAGVGTGVGALPGTGPSVGSFVTYNFYSGITRKPEQLGKGSIGGLAAVDSAGNAGATGGLIPTLGLGIPGSAPMAVVMAALASQGLIPGPQLMQSRPGLISSIFGGLIVATFLMLILGYLSIGPSSLVGRVNRAYITSATLVLVTIGVYSLRWSLFDVWVCYVIGALAYLMSRAGIPTAPAALAFVLGGILEANLRRGLVMTDGVLGFVSRPVTLTVLVLAVVVLVLAPIRKARRRRTPAELSSSQDVPADRPELAHRSDPGPKSESGETKGEPE